VFASAVLLSPSLGLGLADTDVGALEGKQVGLSAGALTLTAFVSVFLHPAAAQALGTWGAPGVGGSEALAGVPSSTQRLSSPQAALF
jgi:hypothetical protein